LKPQDVVLALKLVAHGRQPWKQPELAKALHISASEVNHGLRRLAASHLYNADERRVVRASLKEFLVHGLRYVFPAQLGMFGEGLLTAYSARPLADKLRLGPNDNVVWLVRDGRHRGHAIEPLYRTAPRAAAEDPALHELLALADALRVGRARERALAVEELAKRLETS
jgi:hypothetical protein